MVRLALTTALVSIFAGLCQAASPDVGELSRWRLINTTADETVVYESLGPGERCRDRSDLPGSFAETITEATSSVATAVPRDDAYKLVRRDYATPFDLTLFRTDGSLRHMRVARVITGILPLKDGEVETFCQYIAAGSARAATNTREAVLMPDPEFGTTIVDTVPGRTGNPAATPRWKVDLSAAEPTEYALKGADKPPAPRQFAAAVDNPAALEAMGGRSIAIFERLRVVPFAATVSAARGREPLWSIAWEGCDSQGSDCAFAWGVFRAGDGDLVPLRLEAVYGGESEVDIGLVVGVMDLDGDGVDEMIVRHTYYEGTSLDLVTSRDGRLMTLYRGGYIGL